MHATDNNETQREERALADRKIGEPPPLNQWQFSLRSLLILVTGWALLLRHRVTIS
jgi:hypothetical protein